MPTKVTNPMARKGEERYPTCPYCGFHYTALGLTRHKNKCPKRMFSRKPGGGLWRGGKR